MFADDAVSSTSNMRTRQQRSAVRPRLSPFAASAMPRRAGSRGAIGVHFSEGFEAGPSVGTSLELLNTRERSQDPSHQPSPRRDTRQVPEEPAKVATAPVAEFSEPELCQTPDAIADAALQKSQRLLAQLLELELDHASQSNVLESTTERPSTSEAKAPKSTASSSKHRHSPEVGDKYPESDFEDCESSEIWEVQSVTSSASTDLFNSRHSFGSNRRSSNKHVESTVLEQPGQLRKHPNDTPPDVLVRPWPPSRNSCGSPRLRAMCRPQHPTATAAATASGLRPSGTSPRLVQKSIAVTSIYNYYAWE